MGSVRVSDLAERAQVTQQAMGKMLKELERMGYIQRGVDDADKRAKEIRLTDKGVQLVADSLVAVQEVKEHYAEKVGIDDLNRLEDGLRDVVRRLDLEYLPESWTDGQ